MSRTDGEIKGLISICFNPLVSLRDSLNLNSELDENGMPVTNKTAPKPPAEPADTGYLYKSKSPAAALRDAALAARGARPDAPRSRAPHDGAELRAHGGAAGRYAEGTHHSPP